MNITKSNMIFMVETLKEKELKFFILTLSKQYHCQYKNGAFSSDEQYFDESKLFESIQTNIIKNIFIETTVDYNEFLKKIQYKSYLESLTTDDLIENITKRYELFFNKKLILPKEPDNFQLSQNLAQRIIKNLVMLVSSKIIDEQHELILEDVKKLNSFDLYNMTSNNELSIQKAIQYCVSNNLLYKQTLLCSDRRAGADLYINQLSILQSVEYIKRIIPDLNRMAQEELNKLVNKE